MREGWIVEPMAQADLDEVMRIEEASFAHPWPREAFQPDAAYAAWLRTLVLRDAARPSSGVSGYVYFWMMDEEMEIQNLAVAAEERRRGGGWRLMEAAVEEARSRGCTVAYLEVRPSNTAGRELYRRWGFVQAGRRRRYYQDGEDALIMRADLEALRSERSVAR